MLQNSIGIERFLEMVGVPDVLRARLQIVQRSGVDGTAIWDDGTRGAPFSVRTRVDVETQADAYDVFLRYSALTLADPQPVVYCGMPLAILGVLYQVIDVRPVECSTLARASGGLNPPSLGWLECDWDLLPIPVGA